MDMREAISPEDAKHYDTTRLRQALLIEKLFETDKVNTVYSHMDRIIVGGASPKNFLPLAASCTELGIGTDYFLERREMGVINVGGNGSVEVDGTSFSLANLDGLYIGKGAKKVLFTSDDPESPGKFYFLSTPAHSNYPTEKIVHNSVEEVHLGSLAKSNERTLLKYIHPEGVKSCQLVMGLTKLHPNNVWNTMPCHTHRRRMEVYFYFDLTADDLVVHLMGTPQETRHLIVRNEQAVLSPSWSIHSGAGTQNYNFIWGMAGENQTFSDMDHVSMNGLL